MSPPLAQAFLALADDDAFADQRTRPRILASAAAAVVLALGAPLAVLALRPADHPLPRPEASSPLRSAALSSKSSLVQDEE